ncbi:MAG: acetyl-CoA decarbonylase/synthase complex subunit gamma [Kiritimatiellia bacterium]|jgi:acetyl-CoA decarbonylase/synthase complex subunit gamma|nr:acetyl-CoA decarbonylase/synthase complex subunit gamma [Kiritimatiellia bacterium]MDP6631656.1 acetyl-CoA decarbonylase/synthase complex subunit gamma [Kiritimatiellia bacterium]MDP6810754.1 acetyl-CoA decarbonylase/synthase complex subunit gamma [Kiritimatiellia bacterium]MDP7022629.1 acetyl-CoA decarbonylase/synthase complex subunit gamma [Kiritimatiellia bacterium]
MALKALDIFKLLPKTNCKECGCPTCLAFAMKLAQKQASLDDCPTASDDAKAQLEGAAAPPIQLVTIGAGPKKVQVGNETVMFRHDETFHHPPGIGTIIPDNLDDAALTERVAAAGKLQFHRVGTDIGITVVGVENVSGDSATFAATVERVKTLGLPMVLMAQGADQVAAALGVCADERPLIHAATADTCDAFAALAAEKTCPLVVSADTLEGLAELTEKAKAAGVEELMMTLTGASTPGELDALTSARQLATRKGMRSLGYPCLVTSTDEDVYRNVGKASTFVAKYAGVVLTSLYQPEHILPLLTVSQNIYTDPRKPIQVEPKLYEVGAVTPESPLLFTTNFSLTYYTVEGEVEASRVPAYIGVIDTEGTSVLTAFAADKLTSGEVAEFLNSETVTSKVSHKKVIIPGYVSVMSGAIKEDSGWEVLVGPREASGISKYLKTVWPAA